MTLVALNLVAGFQALGTLMAVGLMMLPALAARFWVRTLSQFVLLSMVFALLASVTGLLLSYYFDLASGPIIVLSAGTLYAASVLCGPQGGLVHRLLPRPHLEG